MYVKPEEGVRLLGVGSLPGLVPEEQDQWVDGLGVQPPVVFPEWQGFHGQHDRSDFWDRLLKIPV